MNSRFDKLAKQLAQSITRRRARKIWCANSFILAGIVLALPSLALAQALVPLIEIAESGGDAGDSAGDLGAAATKALHTRSSRPGVRLIYADPSQVTYPQAFQGESITAPSGPDIQVNDPSLDNIQVVNTFLWPFELATESETTLAADGSNIVVSYNSSANSVIAKATGKWNQSLVFSRLLRSAYSVSHDGGQTWKSGFISPPTGSIATLGDGVVAKDRAGNFYYSSLGLDDAGNNCVMVNKSTDHGDTFGPAEIVALDPGADKEWIAVGADPNIPSRDNIYVTWTSYNSTGSTVAFSRSTDGGTTWSPIETIFSYTNDGVQSGNIQGSRPTVDNSTGRLYVPFLHFGVLMPSNPPSNPYNYLRILVSDDGGNTFSPLAFNVPGVPSPLVYPTVPAGVYADQGSGSSALPVIKQGPNIGGGSLTELYGWPRYVRCSRVMGQPAFAAQNGRVALVFEASTSTLRGDPASQSQILALYSKDGGSTWFQPFVVAAATANDPQHVMPSAIMTANATTLYVGYYVQDSNEQVRTELATLQLTGGGLLSTGVKPLSSVRFDLEPNNIPSPIPPLKSENTVNFDLIIISGYALGEYMGVAVDDKGNPMASWGDCRNSWVSPANGFYAGVHPQTDVFFVRP